MILLRRVLCVGDRSVGPRREPLRMLGQPRVVGRTLEGDVQSHLHPALFCLADEEVEVFECPKVGVDGVVPALVRADGIGASRVARLGRQRVVAALSVRRTDWMDGREVQDVEAHAGDAVKVARGSAQRSRMPAVAVLVCPDRAREDLVPGAYERPDAVDVHGQRRAFRFKVAQGGLLEGRPHLGRRRGGEAVVCRGLAVRGGGSGGFEGPPGFGALGGALGSPPEKRGGFEEDEFDVDFGLQLHLGVVKPRRVRVGPRAHAKGPRARVSGSEPPFVSAEPGKDEGHGGGLDDLAGGVDQLRLGRELVVALAENGCLDGERLAFCAFGGQASAFDLGRDLHDRYSADCRGKGRGRRRLRRR